MQRNHRTQLEVARDEIADSLFRFDTMIADGVAVDMEDTRLHAGARDRAARLATRRQLENRLEAAQAAIDLRESTRQYTRRCDAAA